MVEVWQIDPAAGIAAYEATNAAEVLEGASAATIVSNLSRYQCGGNLTGTATGVMVSVALPLKAGTVVTSLTFMSGTTPAGTPTNWWFALYSPAGALIAQTADQTTTAWAANTPKTLALSAAHTVTADGVYYAALMVKATTTPTLVGALLHHATVSGDLASLGYKSLAQISGAALTATAPATIATPTAVAAVPLVIAS
jgi:hypothetical protein